MPTILLIDDDAANREPTSRLLRMSGFEVIRAANGRDALELLNSTSVDLILLDLIMPEMDGLTFLRILRGDARFKSTPVVMLSALADSEALMRAHKLGAGEYLVKARFTPDQLIDTVQRQLSDDATPVLENLMVD